MKLKTPEGTSMSQTAEIRSSASAGPIREEESILEPFKENLWDLTEVILEPILSS